jgi:type 1 glutamine amidotransferase
MLLVTGGHDFETNQFLSMFRANPEVSVRHVVYPEAQTWFASEKAGEYDVLVFYDMWPEISAEARKDLLARIADGKGMVALHHTLAANQKWAGYADLVGGKYHTEKWSKDGVEQPASTYLHDVDFRVRILDPEHPVTRGLKDFEIHDETYGGFEVRPGVHPLLGTDEKTSGPVIGWAHEKGKSRIVYVQLGHDHHAFQNANYRRIVAQAIRWTARR